MAIRILQTLKENFQGINRKIPDFLVGFLNWNGLRFRVTLLFPSDHMQDHLSKLRKRRGD